MDQEGQKILPVEEAFSFLRGLEMFGIKLGLEQVSELLSSLGDPQKKLRFIHVAGSNGKGSVCAMLSACLQAAGLKVGFYSSPHLVSPLERFRVNGRALSPGAFAALVSELRVAVSEMAGQGRCPTYFESTTALAALHFARESVDAVVWETGMGGRFDATNIVDPVCSIITGISLEHQEYLGDTLAKIAFEKAGIIKHDRPVFCGSLGPEARAVIAGKAAEYLAPIFFPSDNAALRDISNFDGKTQSFVLDGKRFELSLAGKMQRQNASLALGVLRWLCGEWGLDFDRACAGLRNTRWPARLQFLKDGTVVDGAHNPEGAQMLADCLAESCPGEKFCVLFANFSDKDTVSILRSLAPLASEFIFVPILGRRPSRRPEDLQALLAEFSNVPSRAAGSVAEALGMTRDSRLLIAGSLYLAGEALSTLLPEDQILNI